MTLAADVRRIDRCSLVGFGPQVKLRRNLFGSSSQGFDNSILMLCTADPRLGKRRTQGHLYFLACIEYWNGITETVRNALLPIGGKARLANSPILFLQFSAVRDGSLRETVGTITLQKLFA